MSKKQQSTGLPSLDRERKIELIERTLGIKHKLKVFDSMKVAESHEEMSLNLIARWELEDELAAIEEVLHGLRRLNIEAKKSAITKDGAVVQRRKPV